MFLKVADNYINTAHIKQIRSEGRPQRAGQYVKVDMLDGSMIEGFCREERIADLTRQIFPTVPGLEISCWAYDANNLEALPRLIRETLVGFAYDSFNELLPVTVESGVIEGSYNLKYKDGVRASWGEHFRSEAEMLAAARVRFSKAA